MTSQPESKQGKKQAPKPGVPIKLTKSVVDAITEPGIYPDTEVKGFKLRVGASGVKSYQLVVKVKAPPKMATTEAERTTSEGEDSGALSPKYITIGRHGDPWTPDSARREAENLRNFWRNPAAQKEAMAEQERAEEKAKAEAKTKAVEQAKQLARQLTLKVAFEDFLDKNQKESTIKVYRYVVGKHFKDWLEKPLLDITQKDVKDRYDKINNVSHSSAAHAMRILRAIFKSAQIRHSDEHPELLRLNPVTILSHARNDWNTLEPKEDFIEDEDLPAFYKAVQELPNPVARDFLMVSVLTGLRLNEVCRLKWGENVDIYRKTITVKSGKERGKQPAEKKGATAKNKQKHMLVMSDYLYSVFLSRWNDREKEYVFPGRSAAGNFSDPETAINRVIETAEIPAFTSHSLRRTFATAADSLGYRLEEVQRLLNHTPGTITQRHYIQHVAERTREPMQRITDHLLKLMDAERDAQTAVANVVPLKAKTKTVTG